MKAKKERGVHAHLEELAKVDTSSLLFVKLEEEGLHGRLRQLEVGPAQRLSLRYTSHRERASKQTRVSPTTRTSARQTRDGSKWYHLRQVDGARLAWVVEVKGLSDGIDVSEQRNELCDRSVHACVRKEGRVVSCSQASTTTLACRGVLYLTCRCYRYRYRQTWTPLSPLYRCARVRKQPIDHSRVKGGGGKSTRLLVKVVPARGQRTLQFVCVDLSTT
jgi:hypothetical protein